MMESVSAKQWSDLLDANIAQLGPSAMTRYLFELSRPQDYNRWGHYGFRPRDDGFRVMSPDGTTACSIEQHPLGWI